MIVVDTNIISYLLIRGERSEAVDRLLDSDPEWVAPRLWLDEFLNVLARHERVGRLAPADALPLLEDALALMEGSAYEIQPERVLAVARRTGCTAYDSQYIALAEDLGVKLFTCDKGILGRCPGLAIEP